MSNRLLLMLVALLVAGLGLGLLALRFVDNELARPGSAMLQAAAVAGSLFLLVPFVFSLAKRTGRSRVPNRGFIAHVVFSVIGIQLIGLHALASLSGLPLVLVLCLLILVLSGTVGRVVVAKFSAATLGSRDQAFAPPDPERRQQLSAIVEKKRRLLQVLDSGADEALFSVTPDHLLRSPRLSLAYMMLARREAGLIGTRRALRPVHAWWRFVHLVAAWLFLSGLIVHIIVVTFFAGYVAEGGDIYWWHLASWGG